MSEGWLKSLPAPDRLAAQRLIKEVGEAKFARIARAYVQQPRSPGRPTQEARDKVLVVQAAILWMTDLRYANYGNAASAVARRARNGGSKRDLPATDKALARRIRECLETADAEFWKAAERQAASEGRLVRRSPNDATEPPEHIYKVARELRRQHAAKLGQFYPHEVPGRQTFLNMCAMVDTFDQLPISHAMRLLGDVANAWAQEHPELASAWMQEHFSGPANDAGAESPDLTH
jgi:hypothetical protein